ncbi:unnamed protein product [Rotaria sp. Silwood1]|nr:unnamed protein product [Rotaria sp. Silwood1]
MKLVNYIKVSPHPLFLAQCLASLTYSIFSIVVYIMFGKYKWKQRHTYLISATLNFGLNLTLIIVHTTLQNKHQFFLQRWRNRNTTIYDSCVKAIQTS